MQVIRTLLHITTQVRHHSSFFTNSMLFHPANQQRQALNAIKLDKIQKIPKMHVNCVTNENYSTAKCCDAEHRYLKNAEHVLKQISVNNKQHLRI